MESLSLDEVKRFARKVEQWEEIDPRAGYAGYLGDFYIHVKLVKGDKTRLQISYNRVLLAEHQGKELFDIFKLAESRYAERKKREYERNLERGLSLARKTIGNQ